MIVKITQSKNMHKQIAELFRILGQPARLRILLALGDGEACVCHLEAALNLRQAYISQQLMALREARLVDSRRDGRNMYYRLRDPALLDVIQQAGAWFAGETFDLESYAHQTATTLPGCVCPRCSEDAKYTPSSSSTKSSPIIEKQRYRRSNAHN